MNVQLKGKCIKETKFLRTIGADWNGIYWYIPEPSYQKTESKLAALGITSAGNTRGFFPTLHEDWVAIHSQYEDREAVKNLGGVWIDTLKRWFVPNAATEQACKITRVTVDEETQLYVATVVAARMFFFAAVVNDKMSRGKDDVCIFDHQEKLVCLPHHGSKEASSVLAAKGHCLYVLENDIPPWITMESDDLEGVPEVKCVMWRYMP